jgi:hypothetical protein
MGRKVICTDDIGYEGLLYKGSIYNISSPDENGIVDVNLGEGSIVLCYENRFKEFSDKIENPKVAVHRKICNSMTDLYERKNHDYGDSFAKMRNEYHNAILIRIFDKYSRIKTLMEGNTAKIKDESIKDTLFDLANYSIMELIEMELEDDNKTQ